VAPGNPPLGSLEEANDDILQKQLLRKEYEEVKDLRGNGSAFRPLMFSKSASMRSKFCEKVMSSNKAMQVFLGLGRAELRATYGNDAPLPRTYHVDGEEKPLVFENALEWLRPTTTEPLDTTLDSLFYANDITLLDEAKKEELVAFAKRPFSEMATPLPPKFGEFNNAALDEGALAWDEMSQDAILNDVVLAEQAKTLAFRASRNSFSIERRRRSLSKYFEKKYGKKEHSFSWETNEVTPAVSEEEHLAICIENRAKELNMMEELEQQLLKSLDLSEEEKKTFEKKWHKLGRKLGGVSEGFKLFAKAVEKSVDLSQHLAICAKNKATEEKIREEFEATGAKLCNWKAAKPLVLPAKVLSKLTPANLQGDPNVSVEVTLSEVEEMKTPMREGKVEESKTSPTSVAGLVA